MDCRIRKSAGEDSERLSWIDAVKGVAVILVLYAHSLPSSPFEDVISTFHVPLFVVITGYLIGNRNFDKKETLKRYIKTFTKNIVPYFVYALIAVFLNIIVNILLHDFS